MRLELCEVGEI